MLTLTRRKVRVGVITGVSILTADMVQQKYLIEPLDIETIWHNGTCQYELNHSKDIHNKA